jgi:peroxiredoxin
VLGTNQQFNAGGQAGKVVVVYYWASWSSTLAEDAKKLQTLITNYEKKGLVLVTVSVDHDPKQATEAAQRSALPGTALYAEGGLDRSPLAATYGILAPPYIMVAGKDGKVTNRNANLATLEDELKKLMP